jgi:hypothetical protein
MGDDDIVSDLNTFPTLNTPIGRTSKMDDEMDGEFEKKEEKVMKEVLSELIQSHKESMKEKVNESAKELLSRHQEILETKTLDFIEPETPLTHEKEQEKILEESEKILKEINEKFKELEEKLNESEKEELESDEITYVFTNDTEHSMYMNIYKIEDKKFVSFNEIEIPYDDLMKCLETPLPSEELSDEEKEEDDEEDDEQSSESEEQPIRQRSSSLTLRIMKEEDEGEDTVFFEFDLLNTQVMLFLGIIIGAVGVWLGYYTMGVLKLNRN